MKTTDTVLKDMDRKFARELRVSIESHESTKELVRSMCDAGLVSDVQPTGPANTITMTCLGCKRLVSEEDIVCRACPEGTLCVIQG